MDYAMDKANLMRESGRYSLPKTTGPAGQSAKPIDRHSKLYESAQEFEAIFLKQMLDAMRKTVNREGGLIEKNQGEDIFEDMLYDEYSKNMAKTAGFGLSDTIYRQLAYIQDLTGAK